jgi:hypothetical protein
MFVQVIQGRVKDSAAVRAALDHWVHDISPGATGWLGSTTGVTDDGTLIALARFESEEAARTNSDRPEQGEWWNETSKLFTGDVSFDDSVNVFTDAPGDPDQAGFVQVMRGHTDQPDRAFELMQQNADQLAGMRPEIIGRVAIQHDNGRYTMAIYFTSEEAAREGERKEPPPELAAQMEELRTLSGMPDFFDLMEPMLDSPG